MWLNRRKIRIRADLAEFMGDLRNTNQTTALVPPSSHGLALSVKHRCHCTASISDTLREPPRSGTKEMVFRSFAVIGAGNIGSFIVDELLRLKAIGTVSSITVVSRSVSISRRSYEYDIYQWISRMQVRLTLNGSHEVPSSPPSITTTGQPSRQPLRVSTSRLARSGGHRMGLWLKSFWQTLQRLLASRYLLRRSSEPPLRSWKAASR